MLYRDLGEAMLCDAFDGLNSCLFAHGQAESGKSYSIMGLPHEEVWATAPCWVFCGGERGGCIGEGAVGSWRRLDRRLEVVAEAVGGGYCRLQMSLKLAPAVRETAAGPQ